MPNTAPTTTVTPDPDPTGDTTATVNGADAGPQLDFDALAAAGDDANAWGAELGRFLAALTGKHVDPASLAALFGAYGSHVQSSTYRAAGMAVANTPIVATGKDAPTLLALMDLRGDLAEQLLGAAS